MSCLIPCCFELSSTGHVLDFFLVLQLSSVFLFGLCFFRCVWLVILEIHTGLSSFFRSSAIVLICTTDAPLSFGHSAPNLFFPGP